MTGLLSWEELEAQWGRVNAQHGAYQHTDLVHLLRTADAHVHRFIDTHADAVAAIRDAGSAEATPAENVDAASTRRRRPRDADDDDDDGVTGRSSRSCPPTHSANDAAFAGLYANLVKIQAPMVRCSRPPFRQVCRLWGVDISYTHMIMAESFSSAPGARHAEFARYAGEDRLVVQLAAKGGPAAAATARLLSPYCDALDLNCGCPQRWAMKEGLGSALLDRPQDVADMVRCIRNGMEGGARVPAPLPCVVKMRVKDDVRQSVEFARQVAAAGAGWVTVHGRTPSDAPAARVRWEAIRLIQETLAVEGVPVVANGAVTGPRSAVATALGAGVGGVMSANGLLDNPGAFYLPPSAESLLAELHFAPKRDAWMLWQHLPPTDAAPENNDRNISNNNNNSKLLAAAAPAAAAAPIRARDDSHSDAKDGNSGYGAAHVVGLWELPATPLEVVSDFVRAALFMDLPYVTTVQHLVRIARAYLTPTERTHLSYLRSNTAILRFFDERGLYIAEGRYAAPLV